MIIESIMLGTLVSATAACHRAVQEHRRQRLARQLAETQFRTILASQDIQSRASAARRAMVDEVRRHHGFGGHEGGGGQ